MTEDEKAQMLVLNTKLRCCRTALGLALALLDAKPEVVQAILEVANLPEKLVAGRAKDQVEEFKEAVLADAIRSAKEMDERLGEMPQ
jgi:hypothetical protein